jgi:Transposase DDE domain group 1
LQIVADQKLGSPLGSQPTLSRWENASAARDLVRFSDTFRQQFIRLCGAQGRERGEILLDLDSTDDPTYGAQQLSFFNGAYFQHMYHPMLIFERHTGCLLAARLRPGNASSHARIVPMLLRLVPRLQAAFPKVKIRLRGDAGSLSRRCTAFASSSASNTPAASPPTVSFNNGSNPYRKRSGVAIAAPRCRSEVFLAFLIALAPGPAVAASATKPNTVPLAPICFLVTNCTGRAAKVFAFYNDRGECENRIEELKNGFRADRLSCHRFLANAFRLLLHGAAYNLDNFFRQYLPALALCPA